MDKQEGEERESKARSGSDGGGKSHNHVIETTSFQRVDFMNHGLHINSLGQKKLILLTAKCLGDKLRQ